MSENDANDYNTILGVALSSNGNVKDFAFACMINAHVHQKLTDIL